MVTGPQQSSESSQPLLPGTLVAHRQGLSAHMDGANAVPPLTIDSLGNFLEGVPPLHASSRRHFDGQHALNLDNVGVGGLEYSCSVRLISPHGSHDRFLPGSASHANLSLDAGAARAGMTHGDPAALAIQEDAIAHRTSRRLPGILPHHSAELGTTAGKGAGLADHVRSYSTPQQLVYGMDETLAGSANSSSVISAGTMSANSGFGQMPSNPYASQRTTHLPNDCKSAPFEITGFDPQLLRGPPGSDWSSVGSISSTSDVSGQPTTMAFNSGFNRRVSSMHGIISMATDALDLSSSLHEASSARADGSAFHDSGGAMPAEHQDPSVDTDIFDGEIATRGRSRSFTSATHLSKKRAESYARYNTSSAGRQRAAKYRLKQRIKRQIDAIPPARQNASNPDWVQLKEQLDSLHRASKVPTTGQDTNADPAVCFQQSRDSCDKM